MIASRLIDLIRFRLFWLKYGVKVGRTANFHVRKLRIGNSTIHLSVPAGEEKEMNGEFHNIFYEDCYGLGKMNGSIHTVLDVGSNVGFFSLAARSHFPEARIHSYEPNPQLQSHLSNNTKSLDIEIHPEAVGACEGRIEMQIKHAELGSLHARARPAENGQIKQIPLAVAVNRIGGKVDLLKLDCEGSEWEIIKDKNVWSHVNHVTMEYHLWANPGCDVNFLINAVRGFGFRITHFNEAPQLQWGILHASRTQPS